jgi:VCBS repeat-containing protein
MATFVASPSGPNIADASSGTLTGYTGGTLAELQDTIGDVFVGSAGDDFIVAGAGGDTIYGSPGADHAFGGAGPDLFVFNTGDTEAGDYVHGSTGIDTILATGIVDFSEAWIEHVGNLMTGDAGGDVTLVNIQTFSNYIGGTGFDRLTVLLHPTQSFVNLSQTSPGNPVSITGFEEVRIIDTVGASNSIVGSTAGDFINGGAGNDTISGRQGNDTIIGGQGDDSINGGDGSADLVRYGGDLSRYSISGGGANPYVVIDLLGITGADTIRNVEYFEFNGVTVSAGSLNNQRATIGGDTAGSAKEDESGNAAGQLTISDPDPGQNSFKTTPFIGPAYGIFTINADGTWTYQLDNTLAAIQALGEGQTLTDTIRVVSFDNTAKDIVITITGSNDAPVIDAPNSVKFAENGTGSVVDADAIDVDGDSVTFSIAGDDAALFTIDPATGVIAFKAPPDFEKPGDADGDNIYKITISASDGTLVTTKPIQIVVTDVAYSFSDPNGPASSLLIGHSEQDTIRGLGGNDSISGLGGNDVLYGNAGNDTLAGNGGNDLLRGGSGKDTLVGGAGQDTLNGDAGADTFDFNAVTESKPASSDVIAGFEAGKDKIDLASIDAIAAVAGDQAFSFIGSAAFTGEGQIRVVKSGSDTLVLVNTVGTAGAEMRIVLTGILPAALSESDFIL